MDEQLGKMAEENLWRFSPRGDEFNLGKGI